MGGISSSVKDLLLTPEIIHIVDEYCLTPRQVSRLHRIFHQGDKDNSGHLNVSEFHLLFAESTSPFLTHLFDSQDINKDQNLSFAEFLSLVTAFCCYSEPLLVRFAFETFDSDGSGTINETEIKEFIDSLDNNSNSDFPKAAKRAMQMFDADGDGTIDFDEFFELNLRFPHLLWPAFRLQFRIQERTLGLNTWKSIQTKIRDKGKTEKKLGPRPICPLCFCLARPVIKDKKSRAYSIAHSKRAVSSSKKGRKSVIAKSNPNAAAQAAAIAADMAQLVAPAPAVRRSSVAVDSLPLEEKVEFQSQTNSRDNRGSVTNPSARHSGVGAGTGARASGGRNSLAVGGRKELLSDSSIDEKTTDINSTTGHIPSGNRSDQRIARRRASEHPMKLSTVSVTKSKFGVAPLPRKSISHLPGQVSGNGNAVNSISISNNPRPTATQ